MRVFGKALQVFGLSLPPLAIILQLSQQITLGQMLIMCVASVAAFWLGRLIEGYAPQ
jgi:hypothetical protein